MDDPPSHLSKCFNQARPELERKEHRKTIYGVLRIGDFPEASA